MKMSYQSKKELIGGLLPGMKKELAMENWIPLLIVKIIIPEILSIPLPLPISVLNGLKAVMGKAQVRIKQGLNNIERRLPFPLKGTAFRVRKMKLIIATEKNSLCIQVLNTNNAIP
jgi:uncharacterized protein YhdP